ncbi:MAG: hypothetical protein ACOY82_06025 [Pseudomonadota bacterium]
MIDGDGDVWPKLAVAVLATWRLAHLFAYEDGPADLIARLRAGLGHGRWGRMLDCFQCVSLWVAAPVAPWIATSPVDACLVWLALSGAACLCERIARSDVVIEAVPEPDPRTETETAGIDARTRHETERGA